jgi:hypothetical protein
VLRWLWLGCVWLNGAGGQVCGLCEAGDVWASRSVVCSRQAAAPWILCFADHKGKRMLA